MNTWQRNQKMPPSDVKSKSTATNTALRFMFKPHVGGNLKEISRAMCVFPRMLAGIFAMQGMFPVNHPALRDQNLRLKMTDVISIAFGSIKWDRDNIPKICFFLAVVGSVAFSLLAVFFVLTGFLAAPAHAGIFDNPVAATDLSNKWLAYLFQTDTTPTDFTVTVPNDATGATQVQTIGSGIPLAFRAMLSIYSSAMLILAVLILVYHLISMLVHTAHDGTVMGRSAHQIWAPVRLVFALALLIPITDAATGVGGFSAGQYLVLQIAKMGSNLATNIWRNPAIGGAVTGQATTLTTHPNLDAENLIKNLFQVGYCAKSAELAGMTDVGALKSLADTQAAADVGHALLFSSASQGPQLAAVGALGRRQPDMASAAMSTNPLAKSKFYYPVFPDDPSAFASGLPAIPNYYTGTGYKLAFDGKACGSVIFPALAMDGAVDPTFSAILQGIADAHVAGFNAIEYQALEAGSVAAYSQTETGTGVATPGAAASATSSAGVQMANTVALLKGDYKTAFVTALPASVTYIAATDSIQYIKTPSAAETALATVTATSGWMTAPGWFASLASSHNIFGKSAQITPRVSTDCTQQDCGEVVIAQMIQQDEKSIAAAAVDAVKNVGAKVIDTLLAPLIMVMQFVGLMNPDGHLIWHTQFISASPVSDMVGLGSNLVDGAVHLIEIGVVFNAMAAIGNIIDNAPNLGANSGSGLHDNKGKMLKGLGTVASKLSSALPIAKILSSAGAITGYLAPLMFGLAGMLMLPGIILFYVLPFLPFINFVGGVVTWLISLLQAIVAIPVIAIAHITPHGEGLPSNSARGAYTMILQIFLRPVMMIFGMLATIMVMNAGIGFLNMVFFNVYKANLLGNADGLLSGIIFMILYSTAAYSIVNAAITAIDDFPLKAVTWIGGGQGVDTNHDIKGSTLGAMAFVGNSAIQSGIKSIQGATSSMAQAPTQQAALNTTAQRDHDSGLVAPNSSGAVTAGQATGPQPSAGSIGQSGRTQPTNGGGGSNMTASNAAPSIKDKPNTSPTIIQPTNAGGGARTPAQQATMEAHRDGRQFSSLNDKPANNGGASLNSTPFGQGRINPAAANSIRSAAATSAAIPTGKAGFQHAVDAARAAGHPKPELAAAQWALESNWGRKVSGDNNYFGIKDFSGGGKTVGTHEVVGGKTVAVNAAFRNYATPQDAFKGLSNLMDKPRYAGVEAAGSLADAAHAIQKGGYATDPEYANKLIQTMRANGVDVGRSTTLASAAPSGIAPQVAEATAPAAESGSGMASTVAHTVLGGLSLIPGLNIVTSGADALLYTAEGDYGNAALSTASMIPGVKWGVVGAKGFKLMRGASKVATVTGKLAREEKLANLVGGGSGGDSGGGGGRPAPVADAPDDSAALAYIAASNRKKSAAHAYGIEDTGAAPQIIVPTSSGGGPRSASRQAAMEALREK